MLPAPNRLKLPVPWSRSGDAQVTTPFFKLVAKRNTLNLTRVGFIITTKVGKATVRNSLKRKLSLVVQTKWPQLGQAWDLVVIVYPHSANATDEELSTSLDKALSKIPVA